MTAVTVYVAGLLLAGAAGSAVAWWVRRRTQLTIRNAYLLAGILLVLTLAAGAIGAVVAAAALSIPTIAAVSASLVGRRWRLSDLGAGEELRAYENQRRWAWQKPRPLGDGQRRYIGGQGQVVHERQWPAHEPYVPMTADDQARVPSADGRHIASFGATGSGKTTSVLRAAAGRIVKNDGSLLVIDQKGDEPTEQFMRALAAATGRPFILFDPRAPDTDRWQPIWGDRPAEAVARLVSGLELENAFYGDMLRQHLTVVLRVMHVAGHWPPSVDSVVAMSKIDKFDRVVALARTVRHEQPRLWRRVDDQREFLSSAEGRKVVASGLVRLDLVSDGWIDVLEPRTVDDGRRTAVALPQAMDAGALVLWRTWADAEADTASAITSLALSDIHTAAQYTSRPWTVLLDEVAAVMEMAAEPALALLQRGRSHGGQVFFVTQSVADIEAITGQVGLLESLTDNFSAFIVHRQTSPDSRDWLAKLMGTIALWGSTDQTTAHGASTSGAGTRRRVREFRVPADRFKDLENGHAIILGVNPPAEPVEIAVDQLQLPEPTHVPRVDPDQMDATEIEVIGADELAPTEHEVAEDEAPQVPTSRAVSRDYAPRRSLRPQPTTPDRSDQAPSDDEQPPIPQEPAELDDAPDLDELRTATAAPARRTRKGKRPVRSAPREADDEVAGESPSDEPPASGTGPGSVFDF